MRWTLQACKPKIGQAFAHQALSRAHHRLPHHPPNSHYSPPPPILPILLLFLIPLFPPRNLTLSPSIPPTYSTASYTNLRLLHAPSHFLFAQHLASKTTKGTGTPRTFCRANPPNKNIRRASQPGVAKCSCTSWLRRTKAKLLV
jgi:hypothetical protein